MSNNTLPTNTDLLLYALVVYGYCFAAAATHSNISSDDPTANGLFPIQQLNYSLTDTEEANKNNPAMSDFELINNSGDDDVLNTFNGITDAEDEQEDPYNNDLEPTTT